MQKLTQLHTKISKIFVGVFYSFLFGSVELRAASSSTTVVKAVFIFRINMFDAFGISITLLAASTLIQGGLY